MVSLTLTILMLFASLKHWLNPPPHLQNLFQCMHPGWLGYTFLSFPNHPKTQRPIYKTQHRWRQWLFYQSTIYTATGLSPAVLFFQIIFSHSQVTSRHALFNIYRRPTSCTFCEFRSTFLGEFSLLSSPPQQSHSGIPHHWRIHHTHGQSHWPPYLPVSIFCLPSVLYSTWKHPNSQQESFVGSHLLPFFLTPTLSLYYNLLLSTWSLPCLHKTLCSPYTTSCS